MLVLEEVRGGVGRPCHIIHDLPETLHEATYVNWHGKRALFDRGPSDANRLDRNFDPLGPSHSLSVPQHDVPSPVDGLSRDGYIVLGSDPRRRRLP